MSVYHFANYDSVTMTNIKNNSHIRGLLTVQTHYKSIVYFQTRLYGGHHSNGNGLFEIL